jgi:hypothetical protein
MEHICQNCTCFWQQIDPATLGPSGNGYCYQHRRPTTAAAACPDFYAREWAKGPPPNGQFVDMRMVCPLCQGVHVYRLDTDEVFEECTLLGDVRCPHCGKWLMPTLMVEKSWRG